jgi:hypothetical protein
MNAVQRSRAPGPPGGRVIDICSARRPEAEARHGKLRTGVDFRIEHLRILPSMFPPGPPSSRGGQDEEDERVWLVYTRIEPVTTLNRAQLLELSWRDVARSGIPSFPPQEADSNEFKI